MKAYREEEIICECDRIAGNFRNDVPDDARISGQDIALSLPGVPDFLGRYLCPDCKMEVARFERGQWRVMTRRGWL